MLGPNSGTAHTAHARILLTNYAINLYQELLRRLIWLRSGPVDSGLVDADARQHNIWSIWHVDTEDIDEFGDGLP